MTLPFRRRHNDAETSHDRARALVSAAFTEPLADVDRSWLEDHLSGCHDCQVERDAYAADRVLLRGLRDVTPEPPRDLWARTAAAIETEAKSGRGRVAGLGRVLPARGPGRLPLGILASALVVLVVVGTALLPRGIPLLPPSSPGSSQPSTATAPGATPFEPVAERVAWVQRAADGSFSLVFANVDHACHDGDPTCAPLADSSPAPLTLAAPPQAVILSPGSDQIAVIGSDAETAGSVIIVNVPTPAPTGVPSGTGTPPTATPTATVVATPFGSASPPRSGHAIISGVTVVGSAGYSADGQWLAFSARTRRGPGAPNLYVWHVGDAQARQLTTDGESFFSGWYGNEILASGIAGQPDGASPSPAAPGAGIDSPSESPDASVSGHPASSPSGAPLEAHPFSFLLDPASGARTDFVVPDVWLPSIDPTGRFVTYWSGTVTPVDGPGGKTLLIGQADAWRPATGRLVLDGWSAPLAPQPGASAESTAEPNAGSTAQPTAGEPTESDAPTSDPASAAPGASKAPSGGPAGTPIELASAPIADFDARFDPTGTRLAVWVLESPESSAGRLWLLVLDPKAGGVNPALQPMAAPGIQALHGFTIDTGRLAWASPAGQDGQPSSVQVLAWNGDDFGQVRSVPGGNPQLVR